MQMLHWQAQPAGQGPVIGIEEGDQRSAAALHPQVAGCRDASPTSADQLPALLGPVGAKPLQQLAAAITAAVIDGDQLEACVPVVHQGGEQGRQPGCGVAHRHHHRDLMQVLHHNGEPEELQQSSMAASHR